MKKIKIPKGGVKLAKVPKMGKISTGKMGGGGRSAGMAMPKMGGGRKKKGMFG
jgi:hypothetical protein